MSGTCLDGMLWRVDGMTKGDGERDIERERGYRERDRETGGELASTRLNKSVIRKSVKSVSMSMRIGVT